MGEDKNKFVLTRCLRIYTVVIVLMFLVLITRVAWLQLINTELYRIQAKSNTVRFVPSTASRGEIIDNGGNVLVTSRPVFNLTFDYLSQKDADIDQVINNLIGILNDPNITFDSVKEAVKSQRDRLFEPVVIKRDIPIELVTVIEERRRKLPGVTIEVQPQRSYPYGSLAGHLFGYVHSIKEELDQPGFEDYGLGDLVGKTGIEKQYEHYLRGENGYRQVEVTAKNQPVSLIKEIPAVPGKNLVLTIELKLQQAMEKAFDETLEYVQQSHPKAKAGGAVLLDVKTGQVLAMTSRPVLNPDDFNGRSLTQELADYYFRITPPALYNRVIQGSYVPGSIFKPITAMSVLEAAKATPEDTVVCTGKYWNPPYIKCTGVHGSVNLYTAMAKSCNVYFQEMARRAGIAQIGKVGLEFGLGEPTGIDLPFEGSGLLPHLGWQQTEFQLRANRINKQYDEQIAALNKEYEEKINAVYDEKEKKSFQRELSSKKRQVEQERKIQVEYYTTWHDYDTYNTGIGQGYNQYTVIELANYTATIANGGYRYKPYIVQKIVAPDGAVLKEFKPQLLNRVTVSPLVIEEVRKAMMAVTDPGGTAYSLFANFPAHIKVGAKTGTAQPGRVGYEKNKDFDGLFIAFAPADDPQIAFAGVIEHGSSGSGSIGRVAKAVFEEYFGLNQQKLKAPLAAADTTDGQSAPEGTASPNANGTATEEDAPAETEPEDSKPVEAAPQETAVPPETGPDETQPPGESPETAMPPEESPEAEPPPESQEGDVPADPGQGGNTGP